MKRSTAFPTSSLAIPRLAIAWEYVLVALLGVLVRFPTVNNNIIFIDEPTYLVRALGINSPETFFYYFQYKVGLFTFSLLPYIIALHLNYGNAILIVRLLGLISVVISLCLIVKISRLAFSSAAPGVLAGAMWLLYLNKNDATLPPLLEYFQTPYLLGAFLVFLLYLKDSRSPYFRLGLAGILIGLAALSKPPGVSVVGVLLAALVVQTWMSRPRNWGSLLRTSGVLCAGVVLPILASAMPYFLRPDTLPALEFNIIGIMSSYMRVGGSLPERAVALIGQMEMPNYLLIAASFTWLVGDRLARRKAAWQWTHTCEVLLVSIGLMMFLAYLGGHAKPHYLIASLPFFLLFAGYRLTRLRELLPTDRFRLVFVTLLTLWIAVASIEHIRFYMWSFYDRGEAYAAQISNVDTPRLVSYIQANTRPDDKIWVYYNAPEIYWMAGRPAATQEPTGTWLTQHGHSPWVNRTYNELQEDRPELVVSFSHPRYAQGDDWPRLRELELIGDWISANYTCTDDVIRGATICTLSS